MSYDALLKGRVSLAGHSYLTTTVTVDREPLFQSLQLGRCVVSALRNQDLAGHTRTLACVVMPDHVHWLLQLNASLSLSHVMKRFKGHSSRLINVAQGHGGAVWQKGFHDHAVRAEESLAAIARYVVENPLRAGLVNRLGDYSLWHSIWDVTS